MVETFERFIADNLVQLANAFSFNVSIFEPPIIVSKFVHPAKAPFIEPLPPLMLTALDKSTDVKDVSFKNAECPKSVILDRSIDARCVQLLNAPSGIIVKCCPISTDCILPQRWKHHQPRVCIFGILTDVKEEQSRKAAIPVVVKFGASKDCSDEQLSKA